MNAIIALILRLILILLAYVFVGWVAYWIFYDFRNIIRAQKTPEILPIKLQVEIGSEKSEKLFTKNEITIGRDPSCDFSLQDEAISQRHCKRLFPSGTASFHISKNIGGQKIWHQLMAPI